MLKFAIILTQILVPVLTTSLAWAAPSERPTWFDVTEADFKPHGPGQRAKCSVNVFKDENGNQAFQHISLDLFVPGNVERTFNTKLKLNTINGVRNFKVQGRTRIVFSNAPMKSNNIGLGIDLRIVDLDRGTVVDENNDTDHRRTADGVSIASAGDFYLIIDFDDNNISFMCI